MNTTSKNDNLHTTVSSPLILMSGRGTFTYHKPFSLEHQINGCICRIRIPEIGNLCQPSLSPKLKKYLGYDTNVVLRRSFRLKLV